MNTAQLTARRSAVQTGATQAKAEAQELDSPEDGVRRGIAGNHLNTPIFFRGSQSSKGLEP